jgi:hypothetical protein
VGRRLEEGEREGESTRAEGERSLSFSLGTTVLTSRVCRRMQGKERVWSIDVRKPGSATGSSLGSFDFTVTLPLLFGSTNTTIGVKYPLDLSYFPALRSFVFPSGLPSSSEQWYRMGRGRISRSGISAGSREEVQRGLAEE